MKPIKKITVSFDCNKALKEQFSDICNAHGIKIGWQLEQLMAEWVNDFEEEISRESSK